MAAGPKDVWVHDKDQVGITSTDLGGGKRGLDVNAVFAGTVSGTVTADQGDPNSTANRWPVQITDGTDLALVTAAGEVNVLATAQPGVDIGDVTVNNGSGGSAVNIQDGGNSITVDGSVTVSGSITADTELPAAAALADNTANPTAPAVGSFSHLWDGANWDRYPGNSTDGALVNLGTNNDVTVTSSALPTGAATLAEQQTQTTALQLIDDTVFTDDTSTHSTGSTKGIGIMAVATPTDAAVNANDIGMPGMSTSRELWALLRANSGVDIGDVDVTSVIPGTGASNLGKAEDGAHTTGDVGVMALGVANESNTQFGADNDYTPIGTDRRGFVITIPHQTRGNISHATTTISASTSETTILSAGASGIFHDVVCLVLTNTSNLPVRVDIKDATSGTIRLSIGLAAKGGAVICPSAPITQASAANNWTATCSVAVTDLRVFIEAVKNK